MRNSICSLQCRACEKRSVSFCADVCWKPWHSSASFCRLSRFRPAASSTSPSCSCMEAMAGMITLSCLPERACCTCRSFSADLVSSLISRSAPPKRSTAAACSAFIAAKLVAVSLTCALCRSSSVFRSRTVSSLKASSAEVCRASVCETRTSSLSNRARTSFTSTQSALSLRASSTMVLSAFLANSPLRASTWPMKISSAIVSKYLRSSASFLSTVLYSVQLTFLDMSFSSSDISSRLENIARLFRLESWKASSKRCSNSWKARPMARCRSISEIMHFMPFSICETTSCC
mmetsp:Transcript_10853/g.29549  ORF Transcript_10853/g.29549 Transcript_10853/m.29549 type:complete len:290 (+) Transcript_10853:608-1477(+)